MLHGQLPSAPHSHPLVPRARRLEHPRGSHARRRRPTDCPYETRECTKAPRGIATNSQPECPRPACALFLYPVSVPCFVPSTATLTRRLTTYHLMPDYPAPEPDAVNDRTPETWPTTHICRSQSFVSSSTIAEPCQGSSPLLPCSRFPFFRRPLALPKEKNPRPLPLLFGILGLAIPPVSLLDDLRTALFRR